MSMKPSASKVAWQPTIPVDQSIFESSLTQKAPLGTRLEVGDRVFYYAKADNTYVAGLVMCSPALSASHQADILTPVAAISGTQKVSITLGEAVTTNQYAEGYLMVSSGTAGNENVGYSYRIKTHTAVASAGTLVLELFDPIEKAITAAAELNLVPNMYSNVTVGSAVVDNPVGITPCDVTSGGYFWLQTYGPTSALHVGATTVAAGLKMGTTGGVTMAFLGGTSNQAADITKLIGCNLSLAATAGEKTPILLTIRA